MMGRNKKRSRRSEKKGIWWDWISGSKVFAHFMKGRGKRMRKERRKGTEEEEEGEDKEGEGRGRWEREEAEEEVKDIKEEEEYGIRSGPEREGFGSS